MKHFTVFGTGWLARTSIHIAKAEGRNTQQANAHPQAHSASYTYMYGIKIPVYKPLRSAGGLCRPLRSLENEKHIKVREADRGPRLIIVVFIVIVVANWRLDNCQKSRRHASGKNSSNATHASRRGAVPPAALAHMPYVSAYPRYYCRVFFFFF